MTIEFKQANSGNYKVGRSSKIQYIVVHYTGNNGDTAKGNASYFAGTTTGTSAHYFVDETSIWQSVKDDDTAWHCGTTGTYYHKYCRNSNSIGVELCSRKDSSGNYYFKDDTVTNASVFIRMLMDKYNIPIENVVRHYDVTHKSCLPLDTTELLTMDGWKNLSEINIGDLVMSYYPMFDELGYSIVSNVVEPYQAEVYKMRTLEATLDHNMLVKPNAANSICWRDKPFSELMIGSKQYQIKSAAQKRNSIFDGITDEEIRLIVWIQGDGSYDGKRIRFHLKKNRKINRLKNLLDSMGICYHYGKRTDGTVSIDISSKHDLVSKYENFLLKDKVFSWKLLNLDCHQSKVFLEELLHVDGSHDNNTYFSTIQQNADVVQAVASTNGFQSYIYYAKENLKVVSIIERPYYVVTHKKDKKAKQSKISKRNTIVSCVTVDSGYIMIRQNGRVSIVGNCPVPLLDNSKWADFKQLLTEEEEMTPKEVNELFKSYLDSTDPFYANLSDLPSWYQAEYKEALEVGITSGTTIDKVDYEVGRRESGVQAVILAYRAYKKAIAK